MGPTDLHHTLLCLDFMASITTPQGSEIRTESWSIKKVYWEIIVSPQKICTCVTVLAQQYSFLPHKSLPTRDLGSSAFQTQVTCTWLHCWLHCWKDSSTIAQVETFQAGEWGYKTNLFTLAPLNSFHSDPSRWAECSCRSGSRHHYCPLDRVLANYRKPSSSIAWNVSTHAK